MEDIQRFLGHSTITTTEGIYAHFDDTKHTTTINRLSDYHSNKTEDDKNGNVIKRNKWKINKKLCIDDGFILNAKLFLL